MAHLTEPARRTPIVHDVDVAITGGGAAGFAAAVAAAREGARTVLVEKFGTLGGCMGTGGWAAGALYFSGFDPRRFPPHTYHGWTVARQSLGPENLAFVRERGIAGEWIARVLDLEDDFGPSRHRVDSSVRVAHVCTQMVQESGAELMLCTYAAEPIVEDEHVVRGLIVQNSDGRQAIRSAVTIDATANAAIARQAGAPLMACNWEPSMNITFGIAGCDDDAFVRFMESRRTVPEEHNRWIDEVLRPDVGYVAGRLGAHINRMRPYADLVRRAWESDGYKAIGHIGDVGRIAIVMPWDGKRPMDGIFWERADLDGKIDTLDAAHMTMAERDARRYMMDTTKFLRKYVPGFENAYLMYLSPYIGMRGGRAIEAERVIVEDDFAGAQRFDDVIYNFGEGHDRATDIPFRQLLPRRVENLLAAGVAAHRKPPNLRCREGVINMGQAAGTAAALAARTGVPPRQIDVRQLQGKLAEAGLYLGEPERVAALLGNGRATS